MMISSSKDLFPAASQINYMYSKKNPKQQNPK